MLLSRQHAHADLIVFLRFDLRRFAQAIQLQAALLEGELAVRELAGPLALPDPLGQGGVVGRLAIRRGLLPLQEGDRALDAAAGAGGASPLLGLLLRLRRGQPVAAIGRLK